MPCFHRHTDNDDTVQVVFPMRPVILVRTNVVQSFSLTVGVFTAYLLALSFSATVVTSYSLRTLSLCENTHNFASIARHRRSLYCSHFIASCVIASSIATVQQTPDSLSLRFSDRVLLSSDAAYGLCIL